MRDYWQSLADHYGVARATGLQEGTEYTADIEQVCAATGFTLKGRVLDIGCGTGRIAVLVKGSYVGADITPAMVEYALAHGRSARLIEGPESFDVALPDFFDRITMLSVFTHVSREVRRAYLAVIARLLKPEGEALVDIFIGPENGDYSYATGERVTFVADIEAAGLTVVSTYAQDYDGTGAHNYFRLRA
jgi:cyclopropane fatty-acyl-phospholipid synthase-like methyltransferase